MSMLSFTFIKYIGFSIVISIALINTFSRHSTTFPCSPNPPTPLCPALLLV